MGKNEKEKNLNKALKNSLNLLISVVCFIHCILNFQIIWWGIYLFLTLQRCVCGIQDWKFEYSCLACAAGHERMCWYYHNIYNSTELGIMSYDIIVKIFEYKWEKKSPLLELGTLPDINQQHIKKIIYNS